MQLLCLELGRVPRAAKTLDINFAADEIKTQNKQSNRFVNRLLSDYKKSKKLNLPAREKNDPT